MSLALGRRVCGSSINLPSFWSASQDVADNDCSDLQSIATIEIICGER